MLKGARNGIFAPRLASAPPLPAILQLAQLEEITAVIGEFVRAGYRADYAVQLHNIGLAPAKTKSD